LFPLFIILKTKYEDYYNQEGWLLSIPDRRKFLAFLAFGRAYNSEKPDPPYVKRAKTKRPNYENDKSIAAYLVGNTFSCGRLC
jgi:hypothetical protein